jgi:HSP20 family protein
MTEIDLFPSPNVAHRCWQPAADVYRVADGWLVKLELAGVRTEDVRIATRGKSLVITGIRRDCVVEVGATCQSLEISYDAFEREIEFSVDLSQATTTATMDQGMLLVRIRVPQSATGR